MLLRYSISLRHCIVPLPRHAAVAVLHSVVPLRHCTVALRRLRRWCSCAVVGKVGGDDLGYTEATALRLHWTVCGLLLLLLQLHWASRRGRHGSSPKGHPSSSSSAGAMHRRGVSCTRCGHDGGGRQRHVARADGLLLLDYSSSSTRCRSSSNTRRSSSVSNSRDGACARRRAASAGRRRSSAQLHGVHGRTAATIATAVGDDAVARRGRACARRGRAAHCTRTGTGATAIRRRLRLRRLER